MSLGLVGFLPHVISTPTSTSTSNNTHAELKPKVEHYGASTTITTLSDPGAKVGADGRHPAKSVTITTGNADDVIKITKDKNNDLFADINGVSVRLDINESNQFGNQGTLSIEAGDGDNEVSIASDVKASVTVKTGKGDDRVVTGGGFSSVYLGDGQDNATLGAGGGELFGEGGHDELYGGKAASSHLNGGSGNNYLVSGHSGSNDQATWIHAEGDEDMIEVNSTTTINTKSGLTLIEVPSNTETYINIDENAGETVTRALDNYGSHEGRNDVTFTGRKDPVKDTVYEIGVS